MSATVSNTRLNVRKLLGDLNAAAYAISDERLTWMLVGQARLYRALAGPIETSEQLDFSVLGGTDAVLSVPAARIIEIKDNEGVILERLSRDEIDLLLEGTGTDVASGRPTHYAALETTGSSVTTLRFYPRPNVAITYDIRLESLAAIGITDAIALEGNDYTLRAIERATAAEAAMAMPDDERARIRLNPAVISSWKADAERFAVLARERDHRLSASVGRIPAQVN